MDSIRELLEYFVQNSITKREQGYYFEQLCLKYFKHDANWNNQFTDVMFYKDYAKQNSLNTQDIGVDLVAKNIDDDYFTAIQCKFVDENHHALTKADLDSFISASSKKNFSRRILVDTSTKELGINLNAALKDQNIEFQRVTLEELENSNINWSKFITIDDEITYKDKKKLRTHQIEAIESVKNGFKKINRGKLIMACGTGKTFTSLKVAEQLFGTNKNILFIIPSLSLMNQTISEWNKESEIKIKAFAVCSDTTVGKSKSDEDTILIDRHELCYPATTDAKKLAGKFTSLSDVQSMNVIFSTYHSLDIISEAQKQYGLPAFDLIICDEAHRTTGATLADEDASSFNLIHEDNYIKGSFRLYMTATPRVYIDAVKQKAKDEGAEVYSMDDVEKYGEEFYVLKFGDAVEKNLLSDYKVKVLVISDSIIARDVQKRLSEEGLLNLDDATKIIGCYKALYNDNDKTIMKKSVAFCNSIKQSQLLVKEFQNVVDEYREDNPDLGIYELEIQHVDGKMNSNERNRKLSWLKSGNEDMCKILTNARCLSEGVDVPSLDAVMFVHPRKSKVDIVQSVGRVMRKAANKNYGYIIIPIVISAEGEASEILRKHSGYSIIWDVINALRSHDESLNQKINHAGLKDNGLDKYKILNDKIEIIAVADKLKSKKPDSSEKLAIGGKNSKSNTIKTDNDTDYKAEIYKKGDYELGLEYQDVITSMIVNKCGTRTYWEDWAGDIAEIASKNITRIKATLDDKSSIFYQYFIEYVSDLRENLNDSISEDEVVEMLAQHLITRPIFNALFKDYNFADNNSVSRSMQKMIDILDEHNIEKESQKLNKFYDSVRKRADIGDDAVARQKLILEMYDKFFKKAFPRISERLGIVYTPVEVVDFIIHSINDILIQEFNQRLGDRNTHIIDPFTGTGTFITRLMQSGLLSKEELIYKYNLHEKIVSGEKVKTTELHANEIVLLAYYIASINIESVYHAIIGGDYKPFEGICLTDTFQLSEKSGDLITPLLEENYHRRKIQKKLPIRVFIGNPPYSAGQNSGNDNNQNVKYPTLDLSIKDSYIKFATNTNLNSLYDSYIRAIRWASDKINKFGIIGFITNAGWIDSNSADGLRKCMQDEFSSIYILNLRGAIRGKSGDSAKKEGQNVFDIMTGVAITIWVKNSEAKEQGKIYYYDIGDYLSREEKFNILKNFKSINTLIQEKKFINLVPNKYNDWIGQRDDGFYEHILIGDKKDKKDICIFENYSNGLKTNRDVWIYNFSKNKLIKNVSSMIDFYNSELERYKNSEEINNQPTKLDEAEKYVANFVNNDSTKIAWTRGLRNDMAKQQNKKIADLDEILFSIYRPFIKSWCFYKKDIIEMTNQVSKIFPESGIENIVIVVTSLGAKKGFSILISNIIIDLNTLEAGCQCFPLYLYEPTNKDSIKTTNEDRGLESLNINSEGNESIVKSKSGKFYKKKHAITDDGLKHFTDFYNDKSINKEDLFYYIYGLLHSEDYKHKYADNLTKCLPRIPCVKTIEDFMLFSKYGRDLAKLHLFYENEDQYKAELNVELSLLNDEDFYVTKMKFDKKDKGIIIYNNKIVVSAIPLEAYDYVINGKSAIEWIIDRQGVVVDKDSQIENNANDWSIETMKNPKYPLELLLKIITVSLKTRDIIKKLPKISF